MAKFFKLDLAGALWDYYQHSADNPNSPIGPGFSSLGVTALENFYQRHVHSLQHKQGRSYGLHVSAICGYEGWECDRSLYFTLTTETKNRTWGVEMLRCFDVGDGMHFQLREIMMAALELRYAQEVEFLHCEYEVPIASDEYLITGTPDAFIEFRVKETDTRYKVVIDFKSTSKGQHDKRTQKGAVFPEVEYERQIQTYMEAKGADYGIILFWLKSWPHQQDQAIIMPRPQLYKHHVKRAKSVLGDLENGRVSPANKGVWCTRCPYEEVCDRVGQAQTKETAD